MASCYSATNMVANPHCGARFLLVDLRVDEISPTGVINSSPKSKIWTLAQNEKWAAEAARLES